MRYIRIMHFVFVSVLALMDVLLTSFFNTAFPLPIYFVSNLAFLGIVLLIQNDGSTESIIKASLLSLWMDLNHVNSFPVFFVSYVFTITVMRLWQRQINSSFFEFSIIAVVALFIKETIKYIMILQTMNMTMSYSVYLAYYILPTILLNLAFIYPVLVFYKKIHHLILSRTQNLRTF